MLRILLFSVLFFTHFISAENNTLKVALYYEALCPDSIRFIVQQLYPSLDNLLPYLNLNFLPFGNANFKNESGIVTFQCQHGPKECYGNKVQACVLSQNSQNVAIDFINCAMSSSSAGEEKNLQECAKITNVSWTKIDDCLNSGLADQLLVKLGEATKNADITYVPTIIFNDVFNQTLQDEGEHAFFQTVCKLLNNEPENCLSRYSYELV